MVLNFWKSLIELLNLHNDLRFNWHFRCGSFLLIGQTWFFFQWVAQPPRSCFVESRYVPGYPEETWIESLVNMTKRPGWMSLCRIPRTSTDLLCLLALIKSYQRFHENVLLSRFLYFFCCFPNSLFVYFHC